MATPARVLHRVLGHPLAPVGLILLMTWFGLQAVMATPADGRAIGIWPIALGTAGLMVSRVRAWLLVPAIGVIGAVTIATQRPYDVSVWLGAGLALEALVTWLILTRGRHERPRLEDSLDLARFLVAVIAGALAVAGVALVGSVATGWGQPAVLALTVATSGLAAQLTLLPFFCRLRTHPPLAGPVERAAMWVALVAVTLAVFLPRDFPSLVMLVLPVLAWGALRTGPYESLAQTGVVVLMAMPLTSATDGPFTAPDRSYAVPVDLQGILLATFAIVCALVTLTLTHTMGSLESHAREVATERDRMRNIVDGVTGVAIIGGDLQGRITLFNPGAERLLGWAEPDVLGLSTRMLHSQESVTQKAHELGVEPEFGVVARTLMGAGPTEMGFVRKDGQERRHWMSLSRVVDDRGEVVGYVSTSEDITDRLEAERRLVESLETEREAVERLREVDRVKDAFVSSVSHELRTPITSIIGYTELLEDGGFGDLDPGALDAIRRIGANSNRLLTLISELLTLSRIQADGIGPADREVDLTQVVVAALAVLSPTIARRDVELDVETPLRPVLATGDRDMLERVVINLTENAVKFTPDGGKVSVLLLEDGDSAVISVTDTGIGVPAHEQQRLFDRFFRSSLAQKRAIPGSGLGLSIAHTIVEKHGGTLRVSSAEGQGSTFRVRLPLRVPAPSVR